MSIPSTLNTSDCFDDLISLKDYCSSIPSTSGYYIDDAGITLHELNKYIGSEYQTGAELFVDKRSFSIAVIESQINTHLSAKYNNRTLIEGKRVGFFQDNQQLVSSPGGLAGIKFKLQNTTSYLREYFAEVSLQLNYTGDVTVYIYDLIQGSILDSFVITCLPYQVSTAYPQIKIDSSRNLTNIAFLYDTTGVESVNTLLSESGCSSCNNYSITCESMTAQGIQIGSTSQKIENSCTPLTNTAGMSVVFSLSCNNRGWLCSIGNLLAVPMIYKTAELIMEYALYSVNERVNNATIIPEKLEERRILYRDNYDKTIKNVLKNISLPSDAKCFECSQPIRYATMLP